MFPLPTTPTYACPACVEALSESPARVAADHPGWSAENHAWTTSRYSIAVEPEVTLFEWRVPSCDVCAGGTNRHHRAYFSHLS